MTIEFRPPEPSEEPALRALWTQAFGEEGDFLDLFFTRAFSPDRCRVAAEGRTVAAMLFWFDCELEGRKIAYLYAVATEMAHRNRGIGAALLADTHRHLESLGYAGAMLVPGEATLFRFYERQGYRTVATIREFTAHAGAPVPYRQVTPEEYARLRRTFLPRPGVVQEGENLRLLACFSRFYAGEDFLAAVGGASEWLGNQAGVPGLLGALGISSATFRTPGEERPYAMGYWFQPESQPERVYLGFAFD